MHKYRNKTIGRAFLALAGLWFILHVNAEIKPDNPTSSAQTDQQYQQLLDGQADRARRAEFMMKEQEGQLARAEALMKAQEALFDRQLKAFARFEKILDTWETQQEQYQKYLDTLPKK